MAENLHDDPPAKKSGDSAIPELASRAPEVSDMTNVRPTPQRKPKEEPSLDLSGFAPDATAMVTPPKATSDPFPVGEVIPATADGTSVHAPTKVKDPLNERGEIRALPDIDDVTAAAKKAQLASALPFGQLIRPTAGAAEEAVTATVDLGADLVFLLGGGDVKNNTNGADWLQWYKNVKGTERHGLKLREWAASAVGERPEGWAGTAEDLIQFGIGFGTGYRILKAPSLLPTGQRFVAGAAEYLGTDAALLKAGARVTQMEKAGFLADAAFMDEQENNLFGVVDNSPENVQNALTRALAADPEQMETWNRLKVGLQGFVVGRGVEKVINAAKSVALWRKAKRLPAGSAERKRLEGVIEETRQHALDETAEPKLPGTPAAANGGTPAAQPELSEILGKEQSKNTDAASTQANVEHSGSRWLGPEDAEARQVLPGSNGSPNRHIFRVPGKAVLIVREASEGIPAYPTIMYTDPAHRGQKIGQNLLEQARKEFQEKGLGDISINASDLSPMRAEQLKKSGSGGRPVFRVDDEMNVEVVAGQEVRANVDPNPTFDVRQGEDGAWRFVHNGEVVENGPAFKSAGEAHSASASLNDFVKAPSAELIALTASIRKRIMSGERWQDAYNLADGDVFNFRWVSTPDNAKAWINAYAEAMPTDHATIHEAMEETGRMAQQLFGGKSPTEAIAMASEILGGMEGLPAKVAGLRAYQHATAAYVSDLSAKLDSGSGEALDFLKLRMGLTTLFIMNPTVKRAGTIAGQTLNIFKLDPMKAAQHLNLAAEGAEQGAKAVGPRAPATAGIFANYTKTDLLAVARHLRLAGGDPEVINHYLRNVMGVTPPAPGSKAWAHFQSLRYNSLLSGTMTHAKNVFSSFATFLLRNGEFMAEGLNSGNKEMFLQGRDQLSSLWLDALESFKMANMARSAGAARLDPELQKESLQALSEALENLAPGTPVSGPKSWLLTMWHAPQTMLMAEDEFFKQLNYRSSVRAQGLADARKLFPDNPEKWAGHVQSTLDAAFTPRGGGINVTAMNLARENTFTRPLEGQWRRTSDYIGGNGLLSFFFPFRRTPINVFLAFSERTPGLWRASTVMREELSGMHGAHRAAQAQSKVEMGQNLWLLATGLAASGHLSGGGPTDPEKRRQLEATGWLPYAIKGTDGKWVSFKAIEPFASLMGVPADAVESLDDLSREARTKDFEELAGAFLLGVAANTTNKTFLTGLSQMGNLLSGRQFAGEQIIGGLATQMIPFGGLLNQTLNEDDLMRDTQSIREKVRSRIPLLAEPRDVKIPGLGTVSVPGVEPVRTILGSPLPKQSWAERAFFPFAISEEAGTQEQTLMRDLVRGLGDDVQIPMPPTTIANGLIDLQDRDQWAFPEGKKQSPYDRMLELYGTGVGKLPPVETTLRAVVDGDIPTLERIFGKSGYRFGFWKSLTPSDGDDVSERDSRLGLLRGVLKRYKEAAYEQVLSEYPSLAAKEKEIAAGKLDRKRAEARHRRGAKAEADSLRKFATDSLP